MKKIDFTKYPKVLPYVADLIDKSYFKCDLNNRLNEESFISIVESWINKYEKDIDVMVKNTLLVYNLTNETTGHDCLSKDWEKWYRADREKRFTKDMVCNWWREKFIACISHLYQSWSDSKTNEIKGGASGCMITCSFIVSFVDSDYKSVKEIAVSNFNMSINIPNSLHTEIDICDM